MSNYIKIIRDQDGVLVPIEFKDLPFEPRRVFYVTDVPKGIARGHHAHYATKQLLICIQGRIEVTLHDGKSAKTTILQKNDSVMVDTMVWDSQRFLTGEEVMLVICSTPYDKTDYIEDFEVFLAEVNENE
jgi:dTDP-4-dehydrorhamnose 3,5-epimerase-like enzyme